jgi:hypothetical protein
VLVVAVGCGGSKSAAPSTTTTTTSGTVNPLAIRNGQGRTAAAIPHAAHTPTTAPPSPKPPKGARAPKTAATSPSVPPALAGVNPPSNALPPDATKVPKKHAKKPAGARKAHVEIISSEGVNCQESDRIWMELNLPNALQPVRGGGNNQRVAWTAWVRTWQGNAWSGWSQLPWINGTLTASSGAFTSYVGNTYFVYRGQHITTWYTPYVPAGYYQWYVETYFYADGHVEGGVATHNNANGETSWCDFVS